MAQIEAIPPNIRVVSSDENVSLPVTIIIDTARGTIAFPTTRDTPLSSVYETLYERAPWVANTSYILTTNSRRTVPTNENVSALLTSTCDTFISLRLTVPLCGGKGGFGSILRAQGGRMSSRKKKQGDVNGSSRNLDGRRLRTVAEAKTLAEYLAIKPEMDKREKEERRKRWEDIVASTERKQDELMNGRSQARLDGKWVEDKEEAENKTKEAIERMLLAQRSSSEEDEDEGEENAEALEVAAGSSGSNPQRRMFGWDEEDDDFMSDSEEEDISEQDHGQHEGKGKGKAV